jgi:large subunit ribosomal protein L10Ae
LVTRFLATRCRRLLTLLSPATAGKFPTPVSHAEDLQGKVNEVKATIKFQLKKVLCLGVAVAHCDMTEDQVLANVMLCEQSLSVVVKNGLR